MTIDGIEYQGAAAISALQKQEAKYKERIAELKAFNQLKGHCNVPKGYAENKALAKWVSKHRTEHKKFQAGKPSQITAERVKALNAEGFRY